MSDVHEFDEVAAEFAPGATRQVLEEVARTRAEADDAEGYFRDFADTSPDGMASYRMAGPNLRKLATSGKRAWFDQLLHRVELTQLTMLPPGAQKDHLRANLLRLAELCVAWVEAIDRRELETKLAPMKPRGWLARLVAFFKRRP